MFDHRRRYRCGALCAMVVATLPTPANAQSTAEYRTRVDVLAQAWRRAAVNRTRADSARRRTLPTDTVRGGPLLVITDADHLRLARQTVAIAGPVLERAFGAGAGRLSTRPFLMAPHRYLDPSCDSVVAF